MAIIRVPTTLMPIIDMIEAILIYLISIAPVVLTGPERSPISVYLGANKTGRHIWLAVLDHRQMEILPYIVVLDQNTSLRAWRSLR